eukprot:TRINITY_DN1182_c0_g1_i1.p1 TRINITY_DN1182_c0_g1~~TRINITY_DN1182_c0_g1_i1.p1  ORF type:complete len:103 (+),score=0.93 TRINITY_DN1182_c0_g1_i1:176-484(+)
MNQIDNLVENSLTLGMEDKLLKILLAYNIFKMSFMIYSKMNQNRTFSFHFQTFETPEGPPRKGSLRHQQSKMFKEYRITLNSKGHIKQARGNKISISLLGGN